MKQISKYFRLFVFIFVLVLVLVSNASIYRMTSGALQLYPPPDTIEPDTNEIELIYPFQDDPGIPFQQPDTNALFLKTPSNIETVVEYDPVTGQYIFKKKIGDFYYRDPTYMSLDEYRRYELNQSIKNYWKERSLTAGQDQREGIIPQIHIANKAFDKIFGGSTIDIRPQGSAELTFGVLANRRDDPLLNVRQQRTVNFDFKEKIQMNVVAKIGDKIEFKTNYNTESQFDFENKLKLKYEGDEDDIIKLIEAGDVSLPLNTSLITGSQALFGVKTRLQFGRTTVTGVFSQQESESSTITVEGGAQRNEFELTALDYEENRHFFLARYFRGQYEGALAELPVVSSDINITKMEVWVTNIGAAVTENRNIVAFTDLGSYDPYNDKIQPKPGRRLPSNNTNNLISQLDTTKVRDINIVSNYLKGDPFGIGQGGYMVSGEDFEKVESARKLEPSEYTINSKLGFISLNTNLNSDQVLAVAFQYTKIGDTAVYQVGEFSDQGITSPNCLIVKLLKSTSLNVNNPLWKLMMKNVYNIGAYQVNQQDFMLNIFYSGNENGVPTAYFTEGPEDVKGVPLLRLFNFDKLDQQLNPFPDGMFDFINGAATSGGTIQASNGRVYFTVLEPFGRHMRKIFEQDTALASKYAYDSLYTLTKTGAEQFPDKNKYLIQGYYKSSVSNEISLNAFNVPRGSVTVTAGGRQLVENVDYTVDYTLGRVRIINEGILNSGTPIKINLENNALFSIQTKRLMGLNFEHRISENFNFGGTILNLTERPLTQKTNYGDSPISNTIYGFNLDYETESRWLTKMVDNIPLIETKAPSRISMEGEFAHFLPGHSRAIGKTGTSYIDDFEGSKSTIDLKNIGSWFLASTPQGQTELFPEAALTEGINYGKNRAKLAWYIIDPIFYDRTGNLRPPNITTDEISKNSVRQVLETEIFPEKEVPSGQPTNIPILNLAYYPDEKGPYNYDIEPVSGISAGIDDEGRLQDPDSRWGGMMRKIESSDFEATNVEYIEFWMMDPFSGDSANSGKLYINLGDVSEDILRDGRKSFENGLPTGPEVSNVDTTIWGRVPTVQALVESFDDQPSSRPYQDVGYDGLMDDDERSFLESNPYGNNYLALIRQKYLDGEITAEAFDNIVADPSTDNYQYFRGEAITETSIAERYKNYNNPDGNSPTDEQNPEPYPIAATTLPNVEDINRDNTLSEAERYYQYVVELDPDKMKVGENFIADIHEAVGVNLPNKETTNVKWYQFKIPVRSPDKVVGNIQDFRSIRFMRVFMKDFEKPVICRFATLELVRGEWRRYNQPLLAPGEYIPSNQQAETQFDISAVNVEENSGRNPVNYTLPPGIDREINIGTTNLTQQNEQSMVLKVIDLTDGAAKGAFKTTDFDFRQYGHLKMFVHAEKVFANENLDYGDMTVFIRFGSDLTENYYEYELPLTFTDWSPGEVVRDPALIWPEANNVDIDLEKIVQIKQNRNVK
ncbi:MAG: cell surface protein SprA, partial [Bacteroidales bacterium]|nr:cell surface protein SprA [Bacteroidales bacterium]